MASVSTLPHGRARGFSFSQAKERGLSFVSAIGEHQIFMLGGSIAYTTALALAPFVLILLAFASLLGQSFQNRMYAQMTALLGEQAGQAVKIVVENADNSKSITTISGLVGFIVLALSASAVFSQLRTALDLINETPEEKQPSGIMGFFRDKFLSLGLVFGFVFLAVTSLAATALISGFFEGQQALLWTTVSVLTNVILFSALFMAMFRFIPTEKMPWRECIISGACATFFFLVGKSLIGIYLGNASVGSAYGAAGTFVVFLVWVYYSTLTLLVSYEFSKHVILGSPPKP